MAPLACGLIAIAAIAAAYHSTGDKAFGFWLLALLALAGAANT